MSELEVLNKIRSTPKYYIGIMPQSTASNTIRRWLNGELKETTKRSFLKKFGYEVATELTYKKIDT